MRAIRSAIRPSIRSSFGIDIVDELQALITSLFSAGEQGAIYIPRPIVNGVQSLFQDAAGTTLVTADGDPVGLMIDQSGNGNHATQSMLAARPIYQTDGTLHWLQFDGVSDFMETAAIDFTGTDKMTVVAGLRKLADPSTAILLEHGLPPNYDTLLNAPRRGTSLSYGSDMRDGTSTSTVGVTGFNAPVSSVVTSQMDYSGATIVEQIKIRVNSIAVNNISEGPVVSGNFKEAVLFVGARGSSSLHFEGNVYSIAIRGTETAAPDLARLEQYLAGLSGVTL